MEFTNLETDRLFLKNIDRNDAEFILEHFAQDSVSHYLYDAEPYKNLEEANELIDFYLEPMPRDQHRWILINKKTGGKIGTCGFHRWDHNKQSIEMGYDLDEKYCRQGMMSEAIEEILNFARDEMHIKKVYAQIYPENVASVALAERMGFTYRGEDEVLNFRGIDYLHHMYELDF